MRLGQPALTPKKIDVRFVAPLGLAMSENLPRGGALYLALQSKICGSLRLPLSIIVARVHKRAFTPRRDVRFLLARVTLESHRRFAFEEVGCSHLAHEVHAAAHTLDFSEAGQ